MAQVDVAVHFTMVDVEPWLGNFVPLPLVVMLDAGEELHRVPTTLVEKADFILKKDAKRPDVWTFIKSRVPGLRGVFEISEGPWLTSELVDTGFDG